MQFLSNLLGGSENTYLTMALALGIVLVLIVIGLWALKMLTRATGSISGGRNRRLSVVDTLPLDPKRQLVIVRRDNVEHVLLIGGAQDVVVESGIEAAPRIERTPRQTPAAPMRAERPKKPVAEPVTPSPSAPPPAPPTLPRQVAQIREFTRPAEGRRPSSLRHTGLLRPVSALDAGVVRLTPEKSAGALPDSARSETGRTDGLGGTTGGSGTGEQEHWRN